MAQCAVSLTPTQTFAEKMVFIAGCQPRRQEEISYILLLEEMGAEYLWDFTGEGWFLRVILRDWRLGKSEVRDHCFFCRHCLWHTCTYVIRTQKLAALSWTWVRKIDLGGCHRSAYFLSLWVPFVWPQKFFPVCSYLSWSYWWSAHFCKTDSSISQVSRVFLGYNGHAFVNLIWWFHS